MTQFWNSHFTPSMHVLQTRILLSYAVYDTNPFFPLTFASYNFTTWLSTITSFFLQNLFDVINQHEMQGFLSMPSSNVLVMKEGAKKVFNSHFKWKIYFCHNIMREQKHFSALNNIIHYDKRGREREESIKIFRFKALEKAAPFSTFHFELVNTLTSF